MDLDAKVQRIDIYISHSGRPLICPKTGETGKFSNNRFRPHTLGKASSVPQQDRFVVPEALAFGAQLGYKPIQNLRTIDEHV